MVCKLHSHEKYFLFFVICFFGGEGQRFTCRTTNNFWFMSCVVGLLLGLTTQPLFLLISTSPHPPNEIKQLCPNLQSTNIILNQQCNSTIICVFPTAYLPRLHFADISYHWVVVISKLSTS